MLLSLVPEGLRNLAKEAPYSLGAVFSGGEFLNLSGVICPAVYPSIGDEVITVMEVVFERLTKAGFMPEDIVHVRLMIVGKKSPALVEEVNGAYRRVFNQADVAVREESAFPCRETMFVSDLVAGNVEATVMAWRRA
jgi:hypothetical protein